jgi:hypothetical protein
LPDETVPDHGVHDIPPRLFLLLHQLNAAILGSSFLSVVGGNRGIGAVAKGFQARCRDATVEHKRLNNGIRCTVFPCPRSNE